MGDRSAIEWTDATWNPIRARNLETGRVGHYCVKVSPGCTACYAERFNVQGRGGIGTKLAYTVGNREKLELFLDEKTLTQPLHWRKPRKIFVESMGDLFGAFVPDEWLDRIFAVMAMTSRHTFICLTKRAARLPKYVNEVTRYRVRKLAKSMGMKVQTEPFWITADLFPWPLTNAWMGISAEDQERLDERVPELLKTSAAKRFVSAEPLLGPLDFRWGGMSLPDYAPHRPLPQLDWVIVGGESGPGARPMDIAWARDIVRQCSEAGVMVFCKQLGAHPFETMESFHQIGTDGALQDLGNRERLRNIPAGWTLVHTPDGRSTYHRAVDVSDRKGGDPAEWPEDLRVREFPEVRP